MTLRIDNAQPPAVAANAEQHAHVTSQPAAHHRHVHHDSHHHDVRPTKRRRAAHAVHYRGPVLAAPKQAAAVRYAPPATGSVVGPPVPKGPIPGARRVPGLDTPPSVDAAARHGAPSRVLFVGDSHTPGIARGTRGAAHTDLGGVSSVYQIGTQLRRWFVQPHDSPAQRRATEKRHARLVQALKQHPQEVVVSLGTNDGGDYDRHDSTGGTIAKDNVIRRNVREMVGLVRNNGAQLTWALPPATITDRNGVDRAREVIRSELAAIQREIDADTQARGAPPYRINVMDISRTRIPMANGLHPNAAGYAMWGAGVWKSEEAAGS